jgi:hypothetical protein
VKAEVFEAAGELAGIGYAELDFDFDGHECRVQGRG